MQQHNTPPVALLTAGRLRRDHLLHPCIRSRGGPLIPMEDTYAKPKLAIMNAVHDLPVLVARDKGFFKDEGLDIEFVTTPGMAQVTTSHSVKVDSVSSIGIKGPPRDRMHGCSR